MSNKNEKIPGNVKLLSILIGVIAANAVLLIGLMIIFLLKGKEPKTPVNDGNAASAETVVSDSSEPSLNSGNEMTPPSEENVGGQPVVSSSEEASEEPSGETSIASSDATPEPSTEESVPSQKPDSVTEGDYVVTYGTGNSWQNGSAIMNSMEIKLENNGDAITDGWTLELWIPDLIEVQGWDGTYTITGDTLKIQCAEHSKNLNSGAFTIVGCNIGTGSKLTVTAATLNGQPCVVKAGHVDRNAELNQQNQNQNQNQGQGNNAVSTDVSSYLKRPADAVQGDDWLHTDGHRILDKDNKEVWLTGLNWFGYNTGTNTFDGLWNSQLSPTVKGIADHGFNLIRVPISAELINQWANGEYPRANYNNAYNPELNSMNSLEIFDYFLALCEQNGIKVMPDIHSAETNASGHNVNLWYTDRVSAEDYYHALEWMADRYKDNDTIIAFDLKNEPHGKPFEGKGAAIWNNSKDANNWKYVAETAAARILAKNPNVLILVEGTEIYPIKKGGDFSSTDEKDYYFNWWGGNLRGVAEFPVDLGKYQNKLVYSPHDYGPTVYEQPWFEGNYTYDSLMEDCWYDNWLFIYDNNIAPLLIGEWGGFMKEPNLTWMTYMRQLIKTYHLNHTFWCLNANSGDTGGLLLDDFTTWDTEKYNFVKEVLWQEDGNFVGLDHAIPLGKNGISLSKAKGLK